MTELMMRPLAAWSYSLGGMVPQTEQTAGAVESNQVPVPRYTPEVEAAVTEFQAQRDEKFPDYYWQQQIYWDTQRVNGKGSNAKCRLTLGILPGARITTTRILS